ncbi:hypothetical protein [Sphingomonas hylomeconis]|uniref:Uncharacterized protein n=1 Tax=Sphingomonas hylomeconis TaxID=1395958 RepID=A0ABV7SUA5_9SPHN|nr:hypothetical protein [Sphingomonas hylomeconis]
MTEGNRPLWVRFLIFFASFALAYLALAWLRAVVAPDATFMALSVRSHIVTAAIGGLAFASLMTLHKRAKAQ